MSVDTYDPDDDPTSVDEVLYERRMRVLSLRLGGLTYREIAKSLHIDASTARRDEAAAKRIVAGDDMEGVIAGQRAVIADMRKANYRGMLVGDKDATSHILKGLDHEARLLGLYAPTRIQTGPSHIEFSDRAAELIAQLSPATLKELLRGTAADPNSHPVRQPEPIDAEVVDEMVSPSEAVDHTGPDDGAAGDTDVHGEQPAGDVPSELDVHHSPDADIRSLDGPGDDDGWSNI